jgi:hypothetical protein
MDYANLGGFAIAAMGGLMLGTVFGQKLAANGTSAMKAIEARLACIEGIFSGSARAASATTQMAAAEKYAGAIEKLAAAIEKHAAAIDDHGAATVAAAVETNSAMNPMVNAAAPEACESA